MSTEAAAFFKQTSWNFVEDAKNGMIWSMLAYNHICEYLHKQLVRKGRASRVFLNTQKWGPVYFCKDEREQRKTWGRLAKDWRAPNNGAYNINSGGVQPYTRDGGNNLGLSQLFNKQKPTATYNGPSEGEITDYFWVKKTKVSDFSFYCKNFGSKFSFEKFRAILETYKKSDLKPYKVSTYGGLAMAQDIATKLGIAEFEYVDNYLIDTSEATVCIYVGEDIPSDDKPDSGSISAAAYPLFYADSDAPIMGARRWVKDWNKLYGVTYHTKTKKGGWYKRIIPPVLFFLSIFLIAVSAGTYGPAAGATIGAIVGSGGAVTLAGAMATLAIVGAIGGFITTLGMISGNKVLSKIGRVMGWVGAIGSIYTSVKDFFFQSAAAQNASTATNQAVAGVQNASETCKLYDGVSVSSWINTGANAGAGSAARASSIGGFAAAGATTTSQLYLTNVLKILSVGSKAFALVQDIRGAFRKSGDTQDTDMQEQSADEKVVSVNSDANMDEEHTKRRFYERDVEYDIGLEGGTLMSIDDSAMNEPNSAIKNLPTR